MSTTSFVTVQSEFVTNFIGFLDLDVFPRVRSTRRAIDLLLQTHTTFKNARSNGREHRYRRL
jgi:hypothetical protein